jgi:PTH1 family peptidyl-tRNA hydrolase
VHALIGLGNPGKRYQKTRHNAGFLLLDFMTQDHLIPFRAGKGDYYFYEREDILLVKPTTFMNHSGRAVRQIMQDFSLPVENLLVIYDDFNLPFGTIRFRAKGSDGGHNGIKSIIYELETDVFDRLKIGIGQPSEDSIEFVLSEFSTEEMNVLGSVFQFAAEGIETWRKEGIVQAMNHYNRHIDNPSTN